MIVASSGSCRASTASAESSRRPANTMRGRWKIPNVRSHHSFWSDGVVSAAAFTP